MRSVASLNRSLGRRLTSNGATAAHFAFPDPKLTGKMHLFSYLFSVGGGMSSLNHMEYGTQSIVYILSWSEVKLKDSNNFDQSY